MELKSKHPSLLYLPLLWIGLTFLCWVLVNAGVAYIQEVFGASTFAIICQPIVLTTIYPEVLDIFMAVILGIIQSLILSIWLLKVWKWAMFTFVGWSTGWTIVVFMDFLSLLLQSPLMREPSSHFEPPPGLPWWASALIVGALLGAFQYIVLRSLNISAWYWIPTTSLLWAISRGFFRSEEWPKLLAEVYEILAISSNGVRLQGPSNLGYRISIATGEGLIIGLGTGLVLWFILHKSSMSFVDAA